MTTSQQVVELPLSQLKPAPDNIRPDEPGDVATIRELAESIRSVGLLQALVVTRLVGDSYLVVCGHRRLAAAKLAGLVVVPCIVRRLSDGERLEAMVVENLQRRTLSPISEGQAFERMMAQLGYTQAEVAARIGKSPAYVSRRILGLTLPGPVRMKVAAGKVSLGKALGYDQAVSPPVNAFQADEDLQRAWLALRQEVVDYGDRRLSRLLIEFVKALQAAQRFQAKKAS